MNTENINNYFKLLKEYRTTNTILNVEDNWFKNWFKNLSFEIEIFLKKESIKNYTDYNSQYIFIIENPFKEKQCEFFYEESVYIYLEILKNKIFKGKCNFRNIEEFKNYLKNGLNDVYESKNSDIRKKGIRENRYPNSNILEIEENENIDFLKHTIDDHLSEDDIKNYQNRKITNLAHELEECEKINKRVIKYINGFKIAYGNNNFNTIFSDFNDEKFLKDCLRIFYLYKSYGSWYEVIMNEESYEKYRDPNKTIEEQTGPIRTKSTRCSNKINNFIVNKYGDWSRVIINLIDRFRNN